MDKNMCLNEINERIKKEICYKTIQTLSDENLMMEYMNCKSVKNKIKHLNDILDKYMDKETTQKIIHEYLLQLIKNKRSYKR